MQEPRTFSPSQVNSKCSALQVSLLFNYSSPMVVNKFVSSTHVSLLFNYSTLSSNLISFKSSVHIQLSLQQMYISGSGNTSQAPSLYWGFRRWALSPLPLNWLKPLYRFSKRYVDQIACERCASRLSFGPSPLVPAAALIQLQEWWERRVSELQPYFDRKVFDLICSNSWHDSETLWSLRH